MHIGAGHFRVVCPAGYLLLFIAETAAIRLSMSIIRTWQLFDQKNPQILLRTILGNEKARSFLCKDIKGRSDIPGARDFLVPMYLGIIELLFYPFLIAVGSWQSIGAWLGVKVAATWRWQSPPYPSSVDPSQSWMRFLLGNALSLLASGVLATMIRILPAP